MRFTITSPAIPLVLLSFSYRRGFLLMSRTDLIVDAAGTPWFLEVTVTPGMTEMSLLALSNQRRSIRSAIRRKSSPSAHSITILPRTAFFMNPSTCTLVSS